MPQPGHYRNALQPQQMLHEYRLESVLGAGGFGMTYLARDTLLDKPVAIKEYLPAEMAMREASGSVVPITAGHEESYRWGLDRFLQEARTLARFSHPQIVRVNRFFEANGTGYMVMDYEQGESLGESLRNGGTMNEAELKRLLAPLLTGLAEVHRAGFLHRDIKPDNIYLRADGAPVLIDFGAARHAVAGATRSLTAIVTPGYAPMEQYSGEVAQGPWTDLYAMAGVLLRALTGKSPPDAVSRLKNDTVEGLLASAGAGCSKPFVAAIGWALRMDEKSRPQSVAQWRAALLEGAPVPASGASPDAETVRAASETVRMPERTQRLAPAEPGRQTSAPGTRSAPQAGPVPVEAARKPRRWRRWIVGALALVLALGIASNVSKKRAAREAAARQEAVQREATARAAAEAAARRDAARRDAEVRAAAQAEAQRKAAEEARRREAATRSTTPARSAEPAPPPAAARKPADPLERLRSAVREEFSGADANGDGYLSREEARRRFPAAAREFGRVDTNGDGRISLEEFGRMRRVQIERRLRNN